MQKQYLYKYHMGCIKAKGYKSKHTYCTCTCLETPERHLRGTPVFHNDQWVTLLLASSPAEP